MHLFSGATGAYIRPIDSPQPIPSDFGEALQPYPDLDGDGLGDLAVGAPFDIAPGTNRRIGAFYIISGATGEALLSLGSLTPRNESGDFGFGAAVTPDLDGDGRPDLLVGAGRENVAHPMAGGTAYLFSAATGRLMRLMHSPLLGQDGRFGYGVALEGAGLRRAVLVFPTGERVLPGPLGRVYLFMVCRADSDVDGTINSRDISHFLAGWVQTRNLLPGELPPPGVRSGDHDGDGTVTTADIGAFLNDWLATVAGGGCL